MTTNINLLYEDPGAFIKAGYEGQQAGEKIFRFNIPIHQRGLSLGCGATLLVPNLEFSPEAMKITNLLGLMGLQIRDIHYTEIDGSLMGMTFYCQEKK